MKKYYTEDSAASANFSIINLIYRILSAENVGKEPFLFPLFLLSLMRDRYFDPQELHISGETFKSIEEKVNATERRNANVYKSVFSYFKADVASISEEGWRKLENAIALMDWEDFDLNFTQVFEDLLANAIKDSEGPGRATWSPTAFGKILIPALGLPANAQIFNPFAGSATFGLALKDGQKYLGQEWNEAIWVTGQLRILANNMGNICELTLSDTVENWPKKSQKFDLIVSTPPYSSFGSVFARAGRGRIADIELLLENGTKSLTADGKLVVFQVGAKHTGIHLPMLSYLETIILLPYEVSYGFGQPTSVLIFGKKKRSASKKIRIIDASDAISDDANSIIRLNHHLNSIVNSENVRFLDEGFIKNTDHSRLESVFLDKFEGEPLENILVPIIGQSCHIDEQAKVLDRETFFKIDSLCVIKAKELPSIASEDSLKKIEQSCIILPSRWNARPVYFKFSGEPIYVPTSFDAFMIIKENVDPIFLITEISSNAVATQLNFLRKFGHETLLGWEDNRKVKIKLLSPESQKAKLAALEEVEAQIQILEEQLDAVRSGVNRGSFNEFASLKHTLGKPRLQISTWAANLTDFFKTNSDDAHLLNEKFQSAYETGIIDALGQIKDAVEFTTNMLEKGEHGLILEHYALERVSVDALAERIKKLVLGYKNFQIDFKPKDFGKLNLVLSNFNLDLFEVLLQNILVNAERHAFDPLEKGNKVVINLLDNFDTMIVEVKNNGRPFPKNYDRERFITKFRTSNKNLGTGLGGYDIDRIAKYFGNEDWDLDLSDSQYPVSFRFSFVLQTLKFDAKRGRKVTVPAIQRPSIGVTTPSRGKRSGAIASGNGRKGGTSAGRKS